MRRHFGLISIGVTLAAVVPPFALIHAISNGFTWSGVGGAIALVSCALVCGHVWSALVFWVLWRLQSGTWRGFWKPWWTGWRLMLKRETWHR